MSRNRVRQFVVDVIGERLRHNPDKARRIGGVFELEIEGEEGGTWVLDLDHATVLPTSDTPVETRLRMSASVFLDVVAGRMNEMHAFTSGRVLVEGDAGVAVRLREVLDPAGWQSVTAP